MSVLKNAVDGIWGTAIRVYVVVLTYGGGTPRFTIEGEAVPVYLAFLTMP